MTTATKSASKYTTEMEARIREAAAEAPINLETATKMAAEPMFAKAGITARGIASKVRSMNLPYEKKERVAKDGSPVAKKDDLVERIEKAVGVTDLSSLAKAEKRHLKALAEALEAADADLAEVG